MDVSQGKAMKKLMISALVAAGLMVAARQSQAMLQRVKQKQQCVPRVTAQMASQ